MMLFADDLVICEHSRPNVELQLERWRETCESSGLTVSKGKQSIHAMPRKRSNIHIQEKEAKTVKTFKYLDSLFYADGGAEKDVNTRIKLPGQNGGKLMV